MKLGGFAMDINGFGWQHNDRPPTSEAYAAASGEFYHAAIELFSPRRCMFESNFPVEKISISYPVLWNAFKQMSAEYSADERADMFHGTAARVYGIDEAEALMVQV